MCHIMSYCCVLGTETHDKPLKMESAWMLASNLSSQVLWKIPNNKHFYSKLLFEGKLFSRIPLTSVKSANVLKVDPWIKNVKNITF